MACSLERGIAGEKYERITQTQPHPTLVLDTPDEPPQTLLRAVLRAPVEARTWKQLLYLVVVFVLGCAAVCYLFIGIGGGLYLSVFLVGFRCSRW
ncbi:hypothetical protein [Nocardia fusca]|uniref:hypothetical protein n=1 Tax=Nocardia fusca TaxID=941183 RepID=UPI0007A743EB|nr:hypothetical protein [Nocardia fusca]